MSWKKRKKISIIGLSSSIDNCQITIDVDYVSGMNSDFSDIIFTDYTGKLEIPHWIESKVDSTSAKVWIKITTLHSSSSTTYIYMYYDNPDYESSSNCKNTFVNGSDFTTDESFTFIDEGTYEDFGDSSGKLKSNNNKNTLTAADRRDYCESLKILRDDIVSGFISSASDMNEPEDVLIDGNYAYIPCRSGACLTVVDISDKNSPKIVEKFTDAELTQGMGVAKNGNIIYLVSWHNYKLLTIDASDPTSLSKLSSIELGIVDPGGDPDELRKVAYSDGYCFVTHSYEEKLYIVDVADPESLSIASSISTGDGAFSVCVLGDYAYVGGCMPGTSIIAIDVSNKSSPSVSKTLTDAVYACIGGMVIYGNYLYAIAYSTKTLIVIDISDPPNMYEVYTLTSSDFNYPNRIDVDESRKMLYVATSGYDGVVCVSIDNPSVPVISYSYLFTQMMDKAYGVSSNGDYIYVVGRDADGLTIIDKNKEDHSVITDFIVRAKVKVTSPSTAAWLPMFGVSANGELINSTALSNSINAVWYNSTMLLVEFFGIGGTYYTASTPAISVSAGTDYIMEISKVGSLANLKVYTTSGTLVGTSAIATLTNPNMLYRFLCPFLPTASNGNWPAGKVSTQEIDFCILRKYLSSDPSYSFLEEEDVSPAIQYLNMDVHGSWRTINCLLYADGGIDESSKIATGLRKIYFAISSSKKYSVEYDNGYIYLATAVVGSEVNVLVFGS